MKPVIEQITYFAEEGKNNLTECLRLSFATADQYEFEKIVIFTGIGDGLEEAAEQYSTQARYAGIKLVGVTFPQGFEVMNNGERKAPVFSPERLQYLADRNISLVRAHLPFDPISAQYRQHGILAQDMSIVGNALNIFCGSMSLCVQAVLMACDAGEVGIGEHVVVMSSDTALIVRAAPTTRLLTDFIVRQIICKPAFLTVAKSEILQLDSVNDESSTSLEATTTKQLE
jgi:hypothetical protein